MKENNWIWWAIGIILILVIGIYFQKKTDLFATAGTCVPGQRLPITIDPTSCIVGQLLKSGNVSGGTQTSPCYSHFYDQQTILKIYYLNMTLKDLKSGDSNYMFYHDSYFECYSCISANSACRNLTYWVNGYCYVYECGGHDCNTDYIPECGISGCNIPADANCNGIVDRTELGTYINNWIAGIVTRTNLGLAIQAWVGG